MFRMRYITIYDVWVAFLMKPPVFHNVLKFPMRPGQIPLIFLKDRDHERFDFSLAPSNLFALHRNTTSDLGRSGSYLSTEAFLGRLLQMRFYQFYHSFLLIYRLWWLSIDGLWSHLCCECRTEVAIRVFDLAPTGFYFQVPLKQNRICPFKHTKHFEHRTWQLSLFGFLAWSDLRCFFLLCSLFFFCSASICKTFCVYEMILWTSTSVFDCQKTLQEFKSSKVKEFLNETNKAPEVFCSNIVPHASNYFQSCLPLNAMNIIFQGLYECLCN